VDPNLERGDVMLGGNGRNRTCIIGLEGCCPVRWTTFPAVVPPLLKLSGPRLIAQAKRIFHRWMLGASGASPIFVTTHVVVASVGQRRAQLGWRKGSEKPGHWALAHGVARWPLEDRVIAAGVPAGALKAREGLPKRASLALRALALLVGRVVSHSSQIFQTAAGRALLRLGGTVRGALAYGKSAPFASSGRASAAAAPEQ
jgi:hypothetical protein